MCRYGWWQVGRRGKAGAGVALYARSYVTREKVVGGRQG